MDERLTPASGAHGALALVNPVCMERAGLSVEALEALLASAGLAARATIMPKTSERAAWHASLAEHAPSRLIAVGGDGTVSAVANAAVALDVPMGVLPLGTANDFARSLRVPLELEAAARCASSALARRVDLGRLNDRYFLNAAHLGLGVEVARHMRPRLKAVFRRGAYLLAAAEAFHHRRSFSFRVCAEQACFEGRAAHLLVSNGAYFGGGIRVSPEATLEDALLDVAVLAPRIGPLDVLRLARAARHGRLAEAHCVHHFRSSRLSAELPRPLEVNLDGEICAMGRQLEFQVAPGALAVFAPAAGQASEAQSASPASLAW